MQRYNTHTKILCLHSSWDEIKLVVGFNARTDKEFIQQNHCVKLKIQSRTDIWFMCLWSNQGGWDRQ